MIEDPRAAWRHLRLEHRPQIRRDGRVGADVLGAVVGLVAEVDVDLVDRVVQPWQLSDGTLRFIALVTALLQPDPPATIVIDEPELGLHPVALRVFAALVHEVSTRTQILCSTQSPHLVDHFEPEDLVVVQRRDGATELQRMDPTDLELWLQEYTLGDLIEKNVIETNP